MVSDALRKQDWYRDFLLKDGAEPLAFVGKYSTATSADAVANDLIETLSLSLEDRAGISKRTFLASLTEHAEEAGILVLRNGKVGANTHRVLNVEEFLQFFLEKVENKMMEIVSQYSFHELLFWTRRISPINIYPTSEMTVHLYRETLNNVIMKYASGLEDFTVISNEAFKQLIPSYIAGLNPLKDEVVPKVRQVLSDSYLLESLSYFYIYGTQRQIV